MIIFSLHILSLRFQQEPCLFIVFCGVDCAAARLLVSTKEVGGTLCLFWKARIFSFRWGISTEYAMLSLLIVSCSVLR